MKINFIDFSLCKLPKDNSFYLSSVLSFRVIYILTIPSFFFMHTVLVKYYKVKRSRMIMDGMVMGRLLWCTLACVLSNKSYREKFSFHQKENVNNFLFLTKNKCYYINHDTVNLWFVLHLRDHPVLGVLTKSMHVGIWFSLSTVL